MKKNMLALLVLIPSLVIAQQKAGVKFEEGLNWQEVLTKAKAENKYVFVDMVATWCVPCKAMDKFTYPNQKLVEALNPRFISLKVQIDSTAADNQSVKNWYKDAAMLVKKYAVTELPTFLFFSPDGRIVHRGIGMKNPDQLIALTKEATDPGKQLYTLLDKYRSGEVQDLGTLPQLAQTAKAAGDEKLAQIITQEYLKKRIYKMPPSTLKVRDIVFLTENIHSSGEKGFKLFIHPVISKTIDDTMRKTGFARNYSAKVAEVIIMKEEVTSRFTQAEKNFEKEPDWKKIHSSIKKKYGIVTADRVVLNAQMNMFWEKKDWTNVTRLWFKRLNTYELDDTTTAMSRSRVNNFLYGVVFMKVDDKAMLEESIRWMKKIVRIDGSDTSLNGSLKANNMDTYAGLLYKYGKKEEAIRLQEEAVKLDEECALQNKLKPNESLARSLGKMKKNEPIWTEQN